MKGIGNGVDLLTLKRFDSLLYYQLFFSIKAKCEKWEGQGDSYLSPFFCITNKKCEFSLQQSNITEETDFFPPEE